MKHTIMMLAMALVVSGCGQEQTTSPWGTGAKSEEPGGEQERVAEDYTLSSPKWLYTFLDETFPGLKENIGGFSTSIWIDKLSCSIDDSTASAKFACTATVDGEQTAVEAIVGRGEVTKQQSALLALIMSLQMQRSTFTTPEPGTVYINNNAGLDCSVSHKFDSQGPVMQTVCDDTAFTVGGNAQLTPHESSVLLALTKYVLSVSSPDFPEFTFEELECAHIDPSHSSGDQAYYECSCDPKGLPAQ